MQLSPPTLTLALLGPPRVTHADGAAVVFRARKNLALLAYLAVEGPSAQPREKLIGLFWSEATEASARNNLRVALAEPPAGGRTRCSARRPPDRPADPR